MLLREGEIVNVALIRFVCVALLALTGTAALRADEGMWLLTHPPRAILKTRYDFDLTDAWLERVQKASVRFNNGGSGSFVSPHGLVITNHHIGSDTLQKLSDKTRDYYREGFYAASRADELKCPDLELNVLQSIEDVTDRVAKAVTADMTPSQASAARKAVLGQIEAESKKQTGLRSDIVTLYQGGLYHLYRYKKYTDVRLVMAPEKEAASFGGDVDNFEFPRYNLDVCFFRVYENGAPLASQHYLPMSRTGPREGDVVFVSGHPGTTNRLETFARLEHRRDFTLPYTLQRLRYQEALLLQYAERGPEQARWAGLDLYSVANARKAFTGQYHGLLDAALLRQKAVQENTLQQRVFTDPARRKLYGTAWSQIAEAEERLEKFEKAWALLETGDAFYSRHFRIARHLVRFAAEKAKPNAQRLREYQEAGLESLLFQLLSPAPISTELEQTKLTGSFMFLAEQLGGAHPLVRTILAGKSPAERATELSRGTQLGDVAERQRLIDGGIDAVQKSTDPMILLARLIDPDSRQLRKQYEVEVDEPEKQAYALISKARFELDGVQVPPDATFTLRLAFGVVRGYRVDGQELPYTTTFGQAFARAEEQKHRDPFALPKSWHSKRDKLDLQTPFNFVATSDTIGGNSGSPVLNRAGEFVGINFDRNRHGLVRNYIYTDAQARHISVHSRAIIEALRGVYGADTLLKELLPSP